MQTFPFKSVTATALLSLCLQTSHYAQELSMQRTSFSKPGEKQFITKITSAEESDDKSQTITLSAIRRFDAEKSKRINKVFKVSNSDKLDIENKFGKVHVNTWDKNEISVEIVMIARANSDDRAQRLLDLIDVKINQSANLIGFKTQLESINSKGKQGFEVNYTVSMPKNNPLRLKNSFGDAYVANLSGQADLNVEYGSLKTDDLSGNNNTVRVSFGSGDLSSLRSGKLDVEYSKLTLGSSETLDLKSNFSDIKIERVKDLAIRVKYGNAKLGTVGNVQGSSSFSPFRIRELGDKLDMHVQHGGNFEVDKIAKDFKSINLDGSFSSFELNFEDNAAFNFDVDLDFGSVRLDNEQIQFSLKEKKNTSIHYIGKVGKANSDANVKIRAQYGDVRFEWEN